MENSMQSISSIACFTGSQRDNKCNNRSLSTPCCCTLQSRDTGGTLMFLKREENYCPATYPCWVVNALTSFKWKESSPKLPAPRMSHTGMCPRVALVLSLEYERPLFVKTKNLFLKFLNPNLLRPWARFINILMNKSHTIYTDRQSVKYNVQFKWLWKLASNDWANDAT